MAYLGNAPARSFISFERQVFTIVNSQTAYTLSHSVTNENDIRLVVNNIVQEPGSGKAYTASGTTLTLSAALVNGTDEMYCVFLGRAVGTVNAPAGSVGNSQTAATMITGQTAETTVADDDLVLLSDTSASAALKKMTVANLTANAGVAGIVSNADATAMTIDSSERVGIGTSSPDRELTVGGVSNARIGILSNDNSTGASQLQFGDPDNSQIGRIYYEHSDNSMRFHTNNSEFMRILNNGSFQLTHTPPIKTFDLGTTANFTLADNAHIEFTSTSGVWFVTEQSQTGLSAILLAGGGQTAIGGQTGSSYNNADSGTFRWYRPSGQGYYFKNAQGNSCSFSIFHISLRNSN